MRPITLTISAFGPYADKTVLNFDELGMQRLFVITGPTGSGKTTVFEAILYALYGKLSKKGMDPSSLRCDFLKPEDTAVTYVEFLFEIADRQYRIRRQPKQWVAKKRGDGKKEIGQEVVLECVGHEAFLPLTKIGEVDAKIVELIGLEEEQFKKIVMLPQGAFQEFLISNTKEKIELLRNIFNTGMYDAVLQRLKARAGKMTGDYDKVRVQYQTQCAMLKTEEPVQVGEFPSAEELAGLEAVAEAEQAKVGNLSEAVRTADAAYKSAIDTLNRQKQHNEDVLQWQVAVSRRQALEMQKDVISDIEQRLVNVERAEKVAVKEARYLEEAQKMTQQAQDLAEAEGRLKALKAKVEAAEAQHLQASEEKRVADDAMKEVPGLSKHLERLKLYMQKKEAMIALEAECGQKSKERADVDTELARLSERIKEEEAALQKKQQLLSEQAQKNMALAQLHQVLQEERRCFKLTVTALKHDSRIHDAQKEAETTAKALAEKEAALQEVRAQNRRHLAATLADGLEDGMPCPVCGAVHHPVLAQDRGENVAEDALIDARDDAQRVNMRVQAVIEQENRALQEAMAELREEETSLTDIESVRAYQITLKERGTQNKARYDELKAALDAIEETLPLYTQSESTLASLKKEQVVCQSKQTDLLTALGQLQGMLQKTRDEMIAMESADDFNGEESESKLQGEIEAIESRHEKATSRFNDVQEVHARILLDCAAADSTFSEKNQQLQSLRQQVASLKAAFEETRHQAFLQADDYTVAKEDLSKKDDMKQRVEEYHKERTQVITTCDMLEQRLKDDREEVDLSATEVQCDALQTALDEANEALSVQKARCTSNTSILEDIRTLLAQFKELEKEFAVLGQLRDVLDGKNRFNMRFETFAQAYYFERMLEYANHRLARMTHGRYSFRRKEAVRDGRKQAGLDLDVMDQYTGRARDVATLSGGESFKASLSLALGLADVVSSENGGVELSTIFIDEGFGTLDEESLDDTVETLLNLQDSGRLVGVISHVAELKERIPAHLVVTTGNRGSHARFEVRE